MRISSKPGYFFRSLGKSVNGDGLALLLRTGDVPISIVEEGIELVRRPDLIDGGLIRKGCPTSHGSLPPAPWPESIPAG
jgi:hypothetical protein